MPAKRRGHNEGTIKRRSDGRWEAQVSLPNGRRKSYYGKTRRDAQEELRKALRLLDQGIDLEAGSSSLAEYLEGWLEVIKPSLRARTWAHYESMVRIRIVPEIGKRPIGKLTAFDIQRMHVALSGRLSPRSVQHTHRCLHLALERAVHWQLIPRNPCDGARPPQVPRREMGVLSGAEVALLLEATSESPMHALYVVAATTGMRQGELIGLRWSDVDLEARRIQVVRSLQRVKGQGMVAFEPKTARSRRQVVIGARAVAALRALRDRQAFLAKALGAEWEGEGLVFTNDFGRPLDSGRVRTWFHRDLERAGLPRIRFHDLRHTAATLLLSQNVHPKVVSEMLGHSTIALTLDTYSHLLPVLHEEAADAIERALGA